MLSEPLVCINLIKSLKAAAPLNPCMAIKIIPANLSSHRELLIETLYRLLTQESDGRRFDWLYKNNPHGDARAWLAIDENLQSVIGVAAAFPRRVYIGDVSAFAWVLGDFCMDARYRSLGPALQLQRACLEDVDSGAVAFCYDFPSAAMMAVYRRLRINPFGRMVRLAKPLRVDRKVREFLQSPLVNRALSSAGNLLLSLGGGRGRGDCTLKISFHHGDCGGEFSELARKIGGRYGVCTQRSADYLNWRYIRNPVSRYELLTAHRDGALLAYAVFNHTGEDAAVADLFGVEEPAVINSLLDHLIALLRNRGVVTLSAAMIDSHPWTPLFYHAGFKARESCPVMVYGPSRTSIFEESKWFVAYGDRDS